MRLRCLKIFVCLSVCIGGVYSEAVSTQYTFVTSRYGEQPTESITGTTTNKTITAIKLNEMIVESEISLRYARTTVMARVSNPAFKAQEAVFRMLLPETAFISGFVMTIGDKSYKAYVKEKEEAEKIYDQAVSQGIGAAHVTKVRDSNQFVVSANVEPNNCAIFNLTYEELLVRHNGVYNYAINLHPGALVPKLSVTVQIKEVQKITDLNVPAVRTGNDIVAPKDEVQNPLVVIKRGLNDREAKITFTPNLDEQRELMETYVNKVKGFKHSTGEHQSKNEGVLGQFVVQYDVDRPKHGEVLVNDGYFVHFFAPSSLPPLNKYVVFVLDSSGSMQGQKVKQLREAMNAILNDLHPGDFFNIVEFASSVTVHSLKEADQEQQSEQQHEIRTYETEQSVPPSPATPENIARAKVIINRLHATGGTNIMDALNTAMNLIHQQLEWGKKEISPITTDETKRTASIDIERMKTLEPIIIFLTDGAPTVGETSTFLIINRTSDKNNGKEKASIFSLAFGEGAKLDLLRGLSLRNDGFMRYIYEAADAALQLQDFYRQISSPLLADVKFVYPESQVKGETITKNSFRTFYAGSEVVVAGQVLPEVAEFTPQVTAFCGLHDGFGKKRYEERFQPVLGQKDVYLPLERLWSYLTIKQLLDQKDVADNDGVTEENNFTKKALALALKYEFVTPLTSLVVVKPNATDAIAALNPKSMPSDRDYSRNRMYYPLSGLREHQGRRGRMRNRTKSSLGILQHADAPDAVLSTYHLEAFTWVAPLINITSDAIYVTNYNSGVSVQLELTKDWNVPENPNGDSPCEPAVGGGTGVCVYLTRCSTAKNITFDEYIITYCLANYRYAGVCCNPAYIDEKSN